MKRIILILAFLAGFYQSNGQSSPWTFGGKVGFGTSGIHKTEYEIPGVDKDFSKGLSLAFGGRVGYRFLRYFSFNVDAEFQHMSDKQNQSFNIRSEDGSWARKSLEYNNNLQRLQLPLTLQFSPLKKVLLKPYVSVGIVPTYIVSGLFLETERNSAEERAFPFGDLDADFDIPQNKKYRSACHYVAGLGLGIGKHIAIEAMHHFGEKMEYTTFDPGNTFVLPPTRVTYAQKITQFSLIYLIK